MEEIKYKKCSKCGEEKELTAEYWHRDKGFRDGFKKQCKDCKKEYYKKNKATMNAQSKQYYKENREQIRSDYKIYYQENKEEISASHKKWRDANKEAIAEYHRLNYQENRSVIRARNNAYQRTEQGKKVKKISNNRRRAKVNLLPDTLTANEYESTLEYFNNKCAYCDSELTEDNHHMEHIVPVSKGGGTTQKNIIPSCEDCNLSKFTKTLADWYRYSDDFSIEKLAQIAKHLAQFTDWVVSGNE